jgi:hypothetical protein
LPVNTLDMPQFCRHNHMLGHFSHHTKYSTINKKDKYYEKFSNNIP